MAVWKIKVFLGLGLLFILMSIFSLFYRKPVGRADKEIVRVQIGEVLINAELAQTSEKRRLGLSGRPELGENEGMLFMFDEYGRHSFWMKGMKFPLDFIWISDGQVVDLTENVPAPERISDLLHTLSPKAPVNQVLEVAAGFIGRYGVKIGQPVKIEGQRI